MDVPLFTTPTVDLSSTEPPPTVGIVIAVVVIVVVIMLAAAVLVAIVVYYQYRKRLVRETFMCAQFPQYSKCKHTRYYDPYSILFFIAEINLLYMTLTILKVAMMSNYRRVQLMIQYS